MNHLVDKECNKLHNKRVTFFVFFNNGLPRWEQKRCLLHCLFDLHITVHLHNLFHL